MAKVRLGIIGTSGWAELIYFSKLGSHPNCEMAIVCGRNQQRAREVAERYGIPNVSGDWREMIARGAIDAVIVATPDDAHRDMAIAAADAGLHVLCEKPLATNATDARLMLEAVERAHVINMVMFTWRWQPHFVFVRDLVQRGQIGRPVRASLQFFGNFSRNSEYSWRLDPKRGTGALGDLGSHMLDLARWCFGEVTAVNAALSVDVDRSAIAGHEGGSANDSARLMLRFADGPAMLIDVSAVAPIGERFFTHRLHIAGERGMIELDFTMGGAERGLVLKMSDGASPFVPLAVPPSYYGSSNPADPVDIYGSEPVGARYFVDCVAAGRKATPDFNDAAIIQDVIAAAFVSDRERRWVDL